METDCFDGFKSGPVAARGFSLIELMVVVAIAAILASLAMPAYRDYVRRGAVAEVIAELGSGRVVAEQFFLDNRTYNDGLGLEAPCPADTDNFTFLCVFNDADYTITATGVGGMTGFEYTINEANLRTTDSLWGTGNCWIRRKGDTC